MLDLLLLTAALLAGFLGAIVGIGGGIVLVPFFALVLHLDMREALATSLVGVVASSLGASAPYLRSGLSNVRLASFLQCGSVCGALLGVVLTGILRASVLQVVFAVFLFVMAALNLWPRSQTPLLPEHPWSKRLHLGGMGTPGEPEPAGVYTVARAPWGLAAMVMAGFFSSLLGIGGGVFQVLALDKIMGVPLRQAVATSSFMMGVSAGAAALALYARGDVRPGVAAPVVVGVLVGARLGARVLPRIPPRGVRTVFAVAVVAIAVRMLVQGVRGW